jgi:hypothetical protein
MEKFKDEKADLSVMPTWDFVAYLAMCCACVGAWAYAVTVPGALALFAPLTPLQLSVIAGVGPLLCAFPFYFVPSVRSTGRSMFDMASAGPAHFLLGTALCGLPMIHAAYLCF